ncbi:hypothetical protein HWV00_06855 [Moritella sp. 24]|uniref:hypothetical protein n=1 Tax=Moritella sp. 24 TaxID=2746230 RepID=UPI001BA54278|nr:hypothetical protein [Moritella sp. 24]QUM75966.1 hypothetical protein HWV00_06855 [Moritella sp. 24]
MNVFKKLWVLIEDLEKFNIEKKKMRREDRLGEVDYETLNRQDIEQRKLEISDVTCKIK